MPGEAVGERLEGVDHRIGKEPGVDRFELEDGAPGSESNQPEAGRLPDLGPGLTGLDGGLAGSAPDQARSAFRNASPKA